MKILTVSAQKPDSTGSGVYLNELVRAWQAAGHEVAVIYGINQGEETMLVSGVVTRPVVFNTPQVPFCVCGMSDEMPYPATRYCDMTPEMVQQFCLAFSQAIDELAQSFQPDLVVSHHLYLVTALLRSCLPHHRMAAICHSTDLRQLGKHDLEKPFILKQIAKLDLIGALHHEQKKDIVELFCVPPEKVSVIGSGYNDEIFRLEGEVIPSVRRLDFCPPLQDVKSIQDKPLRLVYVGKIWEKKGVVQLIGALQRLQQQGLEVQASFIGGFNNQQAYDAIVAQARNSRLPIEFRGRLEQSEVAKAYHDHDIFVLPSFFEGLPLVLIEALACGCKAVVSDLPGIRRWINTSINSAPVWYVQPPRMHSVDEPYEEDLPRFERELAQALYEAHSASCAPCDTRELSWKNVAQRLLDELEVGMRDSEQKNSV